MTAIQARLLADIGNNNGKLGEFSMTVPDKRVAAKLTAAGYVERVECKGVVLWRITEEGRAILAAAGSPAGATPGREKV